MTSFAVVSREKEKREDFARNFCLEQGIDSLDITLIEKEEDSKNTQSIGIDEVKKMQKKIFLKPIRSDTKAVIIEDAHLLTAEAQNSLLKVLEEPPDHTILILGAQTTESLLPTILSRCQVIELEKSEIEISVDEKKELEEFANALSSMPLGDRLKKAEVLAKNKDEAVVWLEKLIRLLHEKMLVNFSEKNNGTMKQWNSEAIKQFQSLHTLLKTTNTNPRFAIENTFLSL